MAQEERDRTCKYGRERTDARLNKGLSFHDPRLKLARSLWKYKEMTALQAMKKANAKKTTFYKLIKQYENSLKKGSL